MKIEGYIRCGIPDCDWGFELPDLSKDRVEKCYTEFREHCIDRHKLDERDTNSQMFLDFQEGTLTLVRQND
jgi:hypothetical protein